MLDLVVIKYKLLICCKNKPASYMTNAGDNLVNT